MFIRFIICEPVGVGVPVALSGKVSHSPFGFVKLMMMHYPLPMSQVGKMGPCPGFLPQLHCSVQHAVFDRNECLLRSFSSRSPCPHFTPQFKHDLPYKLITEQGLRALPVRSVEAAPSRG